MSGRTIGNVTIECVRGDIADQPDIDAVVNAANAELRIGGGSPGRSIGRRGRGLRRSAGRTRRSHRARR